MQTGIQEDRNNISMLREHEKFVARHSRRGHPHTQKDKEKKGFVRRRIRSKNPSFLACFLLPITIPQTINYTEGSMTLVEFSCKVEA